jgi:hypothetical protein
MTLYRGKRKIEAEVPFTEQDLVFHRKTISRRWWNLLLTFVVLWGIYVCTLFSEEIRAHYQFLMLIFLIPSLFFIGLVVPGFIRLYRDGKSRTKYCGNFLVETRVIQGDKSTSYNLYVFVNNEKRKIRVKKSELEQVISGMPAYVELSVHAGTIFRFAQDGREVTFRQT